MNTNNHHEGDSSNHIPFEIDKQNYDVSKSQNPVTGQYLRNLPPVNEDYDLWLRARGSEDDTLIEPSNSYVIEPGFYFYTSKREITPGEI